MFHKNNQEKFQNVIVTGGCGFIGSHLVDTLVQRAKKVIVIDKVKPVKGRKNSKAKYIKMNVQDADILDVFEKYQPDVTFHLAAHLHDRESIEKPVENAMDNVIGLLNVCEGVRQSSNTKIVFTSSGIVYGAQKQLPITEDAVPRPLTPYGVSKLTGERYLHFYHQVHGTPYTVLRPGNVYGPRQDASAESGVIGIFASKFLRGSQAVINNNGKTTRDYIYVADVVDALLKSAESDFVGVLNIGTGIETSTEDIFKKVKEAVGVKIAPEYNEYQQDIVKNIALNIDKIQKTLDWKVRVTLEEGIEKTAAWYRENN